MTKRMHRVRTHTRRTKHGKTTVRAHTRGSGSKGVKAPKRNLEQTAKYIRAEKAWNSFNKTERTWAIGPILGIAMTREKADYLASKDWKSLPKPAKNRLASSVALWESAGR